MSKTAQQFALEARAHAYAPYSRFFVGAALTCHDGSVYTGCNLENRAYGSCLCAERIAIGAAISQGHTDFRSLAIVGGTSEEEALQTPCRPCGACLQVLSEFCSPQFPILLTDGVHLLEEFLPQPFSLGKSL